jgi:hypothetical protein
MEAPFMRRLVYLLDVVRVGLKEMKFSDMRLLRLYVVDTKNFVFYGRVIYKR